MNQVGEQRDRPGREVDDGLCGGGEAKHEQREQHRADAFARAVDRWVDQAVRMAVAVGMAVVAKVVVLVRVRPAVRVRVLDGSVAVALTADQPVGKLGHRFSDRMAQTRAQRVDRAGDRARLDRPWSAGPGRCRASARVAESVQPAPAVNPGRRSCADLNVVPNVGLTPVAPISQTAPLVERSFRAGSRYSALEQGFLRGLEAPTDETRQLRPVDGAACKCVLCRRQRLRASAFGACPH